MAETSSSGWICATCATWFDAAPQPPAHCPICEDERQYVGMQSQQWLRPDELAAGHRIVFREESGITTLGLEPAFAINQRAFLLPDGDSNILWECVGLVTAEAIADIRRRGGVKAIGISHPHFYSAMAAWSDALGGVPIHLHAADRAWVCAASDNIVFWEGERHALSADKTLVHLPGHFDGSTGLLWENGPRGAVLFPGDALQVAMDRRHISCMYSYPNAIPLGTTGVQRLRDIETPLQYEDVYGFTWGRQIIGHAKARVAASFQRQLHALEH